jgi:uncharacterized protein YbjT (DUF2867 family)
LPTEQVVAASGRPWTILRATQFHPLLTRGFAALARLPVVFAPSMPCQPIAVAEVAAEPARHLAPDRALGTVTFADYVRDPARN